MTLSSRAVPDGLVEDLRAENQRLRAALARSDQPCAYCSLPKDEWAKCASGFPGCDRADDAMGCPELGASIRATTAERERDEAMAALREKEERVKTLESAISWALGEGDSDFGDHKPDNARPFWWRTELRARSVLSSGQHSGSREQRGNEEG